MYSLYCVYSYLHSTYIALGIISNLELIKVFQIGTDPMQILHHFIRDLEQAWLLVIHRGPRTNPQRCLYFDLQTVLSP